MLRQLKAHAAVGATVAAFVGMFAVAPPAAAGVSTTGPSPDPAVTPLGGCIGTMCGLVYNYSPDTVSVTMDWGNINGNIRYLYGGQNTNGWGDVDGVHVGPGRTMRVYIDSRLWGGRGDGYYTWLEGWHKIETDEIVYIMNPNG
ncbi:hypothetical protein [Nonomuraea indica]|uniref:hypothetical protein n=1 Tax=Nonomuraea indica TaxID=1581193 RepID=UPI000C7E052E|nr:hypothetical protein [Nonomuraea indica]